MSLAGIDSALGSRWPLVVVITIIGECSWLVLALLSVVSGGYLSLLSREVSVASIDTFHTVSLFPYRYTSTQSIVFSVLPLSTRSDFKKNGKKSNKKSVFAVHTPFLLKLKYNPSHES